MNRMSMPKTIKMQYTPSQSTVRFVCSAAYFNGLECGQATTTAPIYSNWESTYPFQHPVNPITLQRSLGKVVGIGRLTLTCGKRHGAMMMRGAQGPTTPSLAVTAGNA